MYEADFWAGLGYIIFDNGFYFVRFKAGEDSGRYWD
jgi:hypothetical protein